MRNRVNDSVPHSSRPKSSSAPYFLRSLLDIVLKPSLVHVASKAVHRPAAIHATALPMLLPVEPVAFISVAIVFKKCPVALGGAAGNMILTSARVTKGV